MKLFLWVLFLTPTKECVESAEARARAAVPAFRMAQAAGLTVAADGLKLPEPTFAIQQSTSPVLALNLGDEVKRCYDVHAARLDARAKLYRKAGPDPKPEAKKP